MKLKWSGLIGVAGCFLLSSLSFAAGLEWAQFSQEFYPSSTDTTVTTDFWFTNTASQPITITDISTCCGCTTAKSEKRVYQSGEKGAIQVCFQLGRRTGFQKKRILVQTDETNGSPISLNLQVHIPDLIQFEPRELVWNKGSNGEEQILQVTNTNPVSVSFYRLENPQPEIFEVTALMTNGPIWQWKVRPLKTDQPLWTTLQLQVDMNGVRRNYRVPVSLLLTQLQSAR